jgi:hypothetical protein
MFSRAGAFIHRDVGPDRDAPPVRVAEGRLHQRQRPAAVRVLRHQREHDAVGAAHTGLYGSGRVGGAGEPQFQRRRGLNAEGAHDADPVIAPRDDDDTATGQRRGLLGGGACRLHGGRGHHQAHEPGRLQRQRCADRTGGSGRGQQQGDERQAEGQIPELNRRGVEHGAQQQQTDRRCRRAGEQAPVRPQANRCRETGQADHCRHDKAGGTVGVERQCAEERGGLVADQAQHRGAEGEGGELIRAASVLGDEEPGVQRQERHHRRKRGPGGGGQDHRKGNEHRKIVAGTGRPQQQPGKQRAAVQRQNAACEQQHLGQRKAAGDARRVDEPVAAKQQKHCKRGIDAKPAAEKACQPHGKGAADDREDPRGKQAGAEGVAPECDGPKV